MVAKYSCTMDGEKVVGVQHATTRKHVDFSSFAPLFNHALRLITSLLLQLQVSSKAFFQLLDQISFRKQSKDLHRIRDLLKFILCL